MTRNAIKLNPKDNVAMCITELKKGDMVVLDQNTAFQALTDIPFAHKVSLENINTDEDVIKYGYSIGKAIDPARAEKLLKMAEDKAKRQWKEYEYLSKRDF